MIDGPWVLALWIISGISLLVLFVASMLDQIRQAKALRSIEDAEETIPLPGSTARRLRSAGIQVPPLVFHAFAILLATLAALFITEFFADMFIAGAITLLVTLYAIYSIVFEISRRRTGRFEERLVDAIDIMASTLRGSENPRQALESAAGVVPAPVGHELQEVVRRLELGMDIRRALARLLSDYDSEGVRMFCSALTAKWSTGGDLAPTLFNLNRLIRERLRHRMRIRSRLAGAQISAGLVAVSPYIIVIALFYFNPIWLTRLLAHPLGPTLLLGAICCQLIGFFWLRRMMRVEM